MTIQKIMEKLKKELCFNNFGEDTIHKVPCIYPHRCDNCWVIDQATKELVKNETKLNKRISYLEKLENLDKQTLEHKLANQYETIEEQLKEIDKLKRQKAEPKRLRLSLSKKQLNETLLGSEEREEG